MSSNMGRLIFFTSFGPGSSKRRTLLCSNLDSSRLEMYHKTYKPWVLCSYGSILGEYLLFKVYREVKDVSRKNRSTLNIYKDTKTELSGIKSRGQSYDNLVQQLIVEHKKLEKIKEEEDVTIL